MASWLLGSPQVHSNDRHCIPQRALKVLGLVMALAQLQVFLVPARVEDDGLAGPDLAELLPRRNVHEEKVAAVVLLANGQTAWYRKNELARTLAMYSFFCTPVVPEEILRTFLRMFAFHVCI